MSTEMALLQFVNNISKNFDKTFHLKYVLPCQKHLTHTLDYKTPLAKLNKYGIKNVALKWLQNG